MTTFNNIADQIVIAAATDKDGIILENFSASGKFYLAGNINFGGDGRDFSAAQAAMDHLINGKYIKKAGNLWELTDNGWKTADALNKAQEQAP